MELGMLHQQAECSVQEFARALPRLRGFLPPPIPTSKNYAAKTKKRVWRIFRSRFGKASRASGYPPASRFHREDPNPCELILPPAKILTKERKLVPFFRYPHVVIRARRIVAFLTCLVLESEREYMILVLFSCPAVLSRTLISETVVFIACPAVPRIVRIDRVPVRTGQKLYPGLVRQTRFQAGIGSKEDGPEDSGRIAPHARVTPRGGSRVPQNEGTVIEEKQRFSSGFRINLDRFIFKQE